MIVYDKLNKKYDIKYNILKYIQYYVNNYNFKNFVISFSGGVDSSVLLYIMNDIKKENKYINIQAIHINHQLNKSNIYSNHCINYCNILNIKLITKKILINDNIIKKFGLESSCRILRYKTISKELKNDEILLTAHNKNDNIETFFIFINRGSGSKGLSGIESYNKIYNCILLRPLLNYKKEEIKNFAIINNIKWIEDISNNDNRISRNFVRNKVIPLIEKKWPNFINSVSTSIKIFKEQEYLLNKYINKDLLIFINEKKLLKINELIKHKNDNIYNFIIIKMWLKLFNIITSYKKISIIWNEIINSSIISNPILKINNKFITKFKNLLYCIPKPIKINKIKIEWNKNDNILYLPNNIGYLKKDKKININQKKYIYTIIRNYKYYENISIHFLNNNNLNYIKKVYNFNAIPFWIKNQIPFIFYNEELISILNLFVTKNGKHFYNDFIYIKWYFSPIKKYLFNITN